MIKDIIEVKKLNIAEIWMEILPDKSYIVKESTGYKNLKIAG